MGSMMSWPSLMSFRMEPSERIIVEEYDRLAELLRTTADKRPQWIRRLVRPSALMMYTHQAKTLNLLCCGSPDRSNQ